MKTLATLLLTTGALAHIAETYAAPAPMTTVIYDDALENGFTSCDQAYLSQTTSPVYDGTRAIEFMNTLGGGVNFCVPAAFSYTTDYIGVDFWINGGGAGASKLDIGLAPPGSTGAPFMFQPLQSLDGGGLAPNTWVHIVAMFADFPLPHPNVSVASIAIQDYDSSGNPSNLVYLDDVKLIGNGIFSDSFDTP